MFKDIFKEMFDFNHDGKMDDFEKSAAFATFMSMLEEENKNKIKKVHTTQRSPGFMEKLRGMHFLWCFYEL